MGFTVAVVAATAGPTPAGDDEPVRRLEDELGDAVPRPTDPGASAPFDPLAHRLPDLIEARIGAWTPDNPRDDLFGGVFEDDASDAQFLRFDLRIDGLVNPPGDVDPFRFQPFAYGPHPVYGFVEFDMDRDEDTGGELAAPQYRYLGNIVRFGGNVSEEHLRGRAALDAEAFDGNIATSPLVDRSGEEFHLALLGGEFGPADVVVASGDADRVFEPGEQWRITAAFFHRAHGYEAFSFVSGGNLPGEYMPSVTIQFHHDLSLDETTISLVFPLTQGGAALMRGEPPEPIDFDPSNQASVHEALYDLNFSAQYLDKFPSGDPDEVIINEWADQEPTEFLGPESWEITVLLGSSYSEPQAGGVYFVWSDAYPNVVRGDVDGNDEADEDDVRQIEDFIEAHDASDGTLDGVAVIVGFAEDFSVFDVNHDGFVDGLDLLAGQADGDGDDDDDVDLEDFARLQECFQLETLSAPHCAASDLNLDGQVDLHDLRLFELRLDGPGHP